MPDQPRDKDPMLTLEPFLDAVRDGIQGAGWGLSGLQKTTSHEFEGRWAGESTRSAYLFFHRADLPDSISVEGFLDETTRGLQGNLTLVVEGPRFGDLGHVSVVLERVAAAAAETFPSECTVPLSLRLRLPQASTEAADAEVQLRVRLHLPGNAAHRGGEAVRSYVQSAVVAFEQLLERPEVAELLPPVMD
ncbi:MAG: hypothetical protein EA350_01510 [Gemmatimonadales bacterium]|nr:MAG: hypothetical protein EA350_01510 [Gemmatimonadales bacterium]